METVTSFFWLKLAKHFSVKWIRNQYFKQKRLIERKLKCINKMFSKTGFWRLFMFGWFRIQNLIKLKVTNKEKFELLIYGWFGSLTKTHMYVTCFLVFHAEATVNDVTTSVHLNNNNNNKINCLEIKATWCHYKKITLCTFIWDILEIRKEV